MAPGIGSPCSSTMVTDRGTRQDAAMAIRHLNCATMNPVGSPRANAERLRELQRSHGEEITIFCAHDAAEYAALCGS
jgi:hypothetical protein